MCILISGLIINRIALKRLIIALFILLLGFSAVSAKEKIPNKTIADMMVDFNHEDFPQEFVFKTRNDIMISDDLILPTKTLVKVQTLQVQKERRWHKSGYIVSKLKEYKTPSADKPVDVSNEEIYIITRKYEKVYPKEATILGTEIVLTQGASFFAPGVDILYFFTKGAILRTTHPSWFMAGVSNAYENSICWFWLKGKPIELDTDDEVVIKTLEEEDASELSAKIEKRKLKKQLKKEKKELKKRLKEEKKQKKLEKKEEV